MASMINLSLSFAYQFMSGVFEAMLAGKSGLLGSDVKHAQADGNRVHMHIFGNYY